ncbi:NADPH-dependent FMN reductase [Bacillus chungangensis]|uniref:FMN reductase n=1 Tax=Bacillus chungangensis TaxID=587633 RepID=A0ABT9WUJ4_9BACI|nr:NADPH-dependent FMN reductase [Bacillus chungangensis]MDQ0176778.1 FMN reductase [Bacillus chungangensis]
MKVPLLFMKVLLVSGTIIGNTASALLQIAKKKLEVLQEVDDIKIIDLKELSLEFCDGRAIADYNKDTRQLIEDFIAYDAYIIATPIFQNSIPGVLKNVFDLIPPTAMKYKPVSILANGGTYQHYLVVENQLKPILDYFRSYVTPNYIYVNPEHLSDQGEIIDEDIQDRFNEMIEVFRDYLMMSKNRKLMK